MPLTDRRVEHRRPARQLLAVHQQPRQPQRVALLIERHDDAWPHPRLLRGEVGILILGNVAGRIHLEERRLIEVDRQRITIPVGDRTARILRHRTVDTTCGAQLLGRCDIHAARDAVIGEYRRCAPFCNDHAARGNPLAQRGHPLEADAGPHVVGGVLAAKVRRQCAAAPRNRRPTHREPVDDLLCVVRHVRQHQHIELPEQITPVELLDAEIGIRNLQHVEGVPHPSFVLRVEPGVHQRDSRQVELMAGDLRHGADADDAEP